MTISSVTKDGGYLVIVEDGVTTRRSIVYEDTVCSLPPTGYTEVGVIYVDETNSKLVVQYNGSYTEIELGATTDLTGAEIVALLEALGTGSRLEVTYLDDGSTYIRYTVAEQTKLGNIETAATADQTGAEIVALLEALTASSRLSHTKLDDLTTGDPHTQYQEEDEKGAASGYASLNASTKVTEQPASITDHLDGSPDEDDATKAPTSEWAFDHAALKSANAVLGHVIVETGSDIDVDASGKLTLGAHAARHQDAGNDEISVTGLSGLLADDQHVLDNEVTGVAIAISTLTTRGDLLYRDASVPARLAKGTEGHILTMGADDPAWAAQITHLLAAGATDVTATAAELNLLDLAGLTAGEVLVATAATTAAWQSTGVKLSAPDISGSVTAASALTLPAFIAGGTITITSQILDAGADSAEIDTTGAGEGLLIKSTQDGTTAAKLIGQQVKTTQQDDDIIFQIDALGKTDTDTATTWATIELIANDVSNASKDTIINFKGYQGNAWKTILGLTSAGATLECYVGSLVVNTAGSGAGLRFNSTWSGTAGPALTLYHNSSSPGDNDIVGAIKFLGNTVVSNGNPADTEIAMGSIQCKVPDVTDETEDAIYEFRLINAGAENLAVIITGAGEIDADAAISGDAFDEFDDAVILRRGISERQLEALEEIGVMKRKDTGSGWMLNFQKMMYLLAGGVYQNREKLDILGRRLDDLELALPMGRN